MVRLEYTIPEVRQGKEIANFLKLDLHFSTLSRKKLRDTPDSLLLDGLPVPSYTIPSPGQTLSILLPDDPPSPMEAVEGPLEILYEDDHLLVLNKAGGIPVHPGPDHHRDTLGNFLTHYYHSIGENHLFRPVNRLDKGTSGLMCVAKHTYAAQILSDALHSEQFHRSYLAICEGCPSPREGVISAPIGRLDGSVIARTVRPDGKESLTRYRVISSHSGCSLVRITPETGRTHQIRVHMAYIGNPLLGDFLYGTENQQLIDRPALHSAYLKFTHPISGKELEFQAPIPQDMNALLYEHSDTHH